MARKAGIPESMGLQMNSKSLDRLAIGSSMVFEASLDGGETGLLIIAALPFKIS